MSSPKLNALARKRGVSPIIATILLVAITVVLAAVLYVLVSGYLGSTGSKPISVGLASSTPSSESCTAAGGVVGSTGTVYQESVSVTSTSATVTTSTFGLKLVPATGTSNAPISLGNPAVAHRGLLVASCTGWWAALATPSGSVSACWSAEASAVWAQPVSGVCTDASNTALTSALTLTGGDTLYVYVSTTSPSGAYTLQVFGMGGATISGSADL